MTEITCPICDEEMPPSKQIYQFGLGHVLCQNYVGRDGPLGVYRIRNDNDSREKSKERWTG